MIALPWRPRFDYGAKSFPVSQPMLPWTVDRVLSGGSRTSGAEIPFVWIRSETWVIRARVRVFETEMPTLWEFLDHARRGQVFYWWLDREKVGTRYPMHLISPAVGEDIEQVRDEEGFRDSWVVSLTARTSNRQPITHYHSVR
jgi:hypothetical protein